MKVIILAGGKGSRLAPLTHTVAKPMLPIGNQPVLAHLIGYFERQGFHQIGIAAGYLGDQIESYFIEKPYHIIKGNADCGTSDRLLAFRDWIGSETFILTYGDGLADLDLQELIAFHKEQKLLATLTAVNPPSFFGELALDGPHVRHFSEKPRLSDRWINGGFCILEAEIFSYVRRGSMFEETLETLSRLGELAALRHTGFWRSMDTPGDYDALQRQWERGDAPWTRSLLCR